MADSFTSDKSISCPATNGGDLCPWAGWQRLTSGSNPGRYLLEVQYERVFTDPDVITLLVLGQDVPILHTEISLITPPNVRVDYSFGHGGKIVEPHPVLSRLSDGRDRLIFVEKNLPAFHPEPDCPIWRLALGCLQRGICPGGQENVRLENWKHIGERMRFFESAGELAQMEGTPALSTANSGETQSFPTESGFCRRVPPLNFAKACR